MTVVDITDPKYGAVAGTPTSDQAAALANQTAIQKAIDSATAIYVPGMFTTGGLKFRSGVRIYGADQCSGFTARDGLGQREHLLAPRDYLWTLTEDVTFDSLIVDGNAQGQHGGAPMPGLSDSIHCIALLQCRNVLGVNLRLRNADGDGWYVGVSSKTERYGSDHVTLRDSYVTGCVRNGSMLSRGRHNTWSNVRFDGNQAGMNPASPKYWPGGYQSAELDIEPSFEGFVASDNKIVGCYFRSPWSHAVQITRPFADTSRNRFERCTFEDCALDSFLLKTPNGRGTGVVDSTFICSTPAPGTRHLRLAGSDYMHAERNLFVGSTGQTPVSIDDGAAGKNPAPVMPVFRGNTLDLTGAGQQECQVRYCDRPVTSPNEYVRGFLTVA